MYEFLTIYVHLGWIVGGLYALKICHDLKKYEYYYQKLMIEQRWPQYLLFIVYFRPILILFLLLLKIEKRLGRRCI